MYRLGKSLHIAQNKAYNDQLITQRYGTGWDGHFSLHIALCINLLPRLYVKEAPSNTNLCISYTVCSRINSNLILETIVVE